MKEKYLKKDKFYCPPSFLSEEYLPFNHIIKSTVVEMSVRSFRLLHKVKATGDPFARQAAKQADLTASEKATDCVRSSATAGGARA